MTIDYQKTALGIICFIAGYWAHTILHNCPTSTPPEAQVKAQVEAQAETAIQYIEKETVTDKDGLKQQEKTDVAINNLPTKLTISVNGQQQEIQKSDDEKYIFDKNKLQIEQQSITKLNINIPVKDETRRWGIGAGINASGLQWILTGPTGKQHVDFYASGDKDHTGGGIIIRF